MFLGPIKLHCFLILGGYLMNNLSPQSVVKLWNDNHGDTNQLVFENGNFYQIYEDPTGNDYFKKDRLSRIEILEELKVIISN